MKPLVQNFQAFSPDNVDGYRLNRIQGLALEAKPKAKARGSPRKASMSAAAKAVIAGLDDETQKMIAQVLAKK